jgi:hypothetical protein
VWPSVPSQARAPKGLHALEGTRSCRAFAYQGLNVESFQGLTEPTLERGIQHCIDRARPGYALSEQMAAPSGPGSPATTRPPPDSRTISAAPTSGVTTTRVRRAACPPARYWQILRMRGQHQEVSRGNRCSFSDPMTVRGRIRTRFAIRRPSAKTPGVAT